MQSGARKDHEFQHGSCNRFVMKEPKVSLVITDKRGNASDRLRCVSDPIPKAFCPKIRTLSTSTHPPQLVVSTGNVQKETSPSGNRTPVSRGL